MQADADAGDPVGHGRHRQAGDQHPPLFEVLRGGTGGAGNDVQAEQAQARQCREVEEATDPAVQALCGNRWLRPHVGVLAHGDFSVGHVAAPIGIGRTSRQTSFCRVAARGLTAARYRAPCRQVRRCRTPSVPLLRPACRPCACRPPPARPTPSRCRASAAAIRAAPFPIRRAGLAQVDRSQRLPDRVVPVRRFHVDKRILNGDRGLVGTGRGSEVAACVGKAGGGDQGARSARFPFRARTSRCRAGSPRCVRCVRSPRSRAVPQRSPFR